MRIIYFKKDEKHVLGRAGENGATRITVDVAAWAAEYPSGTGALIYKRPDGQVYPLTTALDGGQLYAVLTSVDTAISGVCRVEAQWLDGDVIVKSRVYEGAVSPSLGEAGSVPEASPSWVDDMTALGVTVAADKAQVAADKATVAADKEAVAADKEAALAAKADAQAAQAGAEGAYAAAVIARDAAQAAKTDAQTAQAAAAQSATEASGSATAAQQTAAQIVTDEAARVTAEQGRVSAEQGRVAAEAQRGAALSAHVADTSNPHGVTAAQIGAAEIQTHNYDAIGRNLKEIFGTAAALHNAIAADDYSKIQIGDYWDVYLTGTYRDCGAYTCPAGTTLYSDTALTTEAGTAATALEAQWIDATYCKVSSGGDKYCATSDCLAYYERTLSNAVIKLEVAAINPYWRYGNSGELTGAKPHVLFVSRDCLPHCLRFRKANTAWHVAPNPEGGIGVWQGSALYATLNDPDYGVLPLLAATDIGAYIYGGASGGGMRYYGETRATEATTTNSGAWLDRGKLFLPTEDEVWGREIFTLRSYQGHLHLPLFRGSRRRISKGIGDGGSRSYWWEVSAYVGNATNICNVNNSGNPINNSAVGGLGAPVCFLAI